MKHISTFFNLNKQQEHLDFVDVKLNTDNRLFIDPRLIEMKQDIYSNEMNKYLESFWGKLIKSIKGKKFKSAKALLKGLNEPNSTRLGFSSKAFNGKSVGNKISEEMLTVLSQNLAVKTGVLSHFSDAELFIPNVNSDRISDISTQIVKFELIRFTQEQCKLNNIPLTEVDNVSFFDKEKLKWVKNSFKLPVYFGKPIILVPKNVVRLENGANSNISCFYRYAIRNVIANDKNMLKDISPSGKDGIILLRDIKSEHPLSKESLSKWIVKYGKLLVNYKSYSKDVTPLSDYEIMEVIYDDYTILPNVG